MTAIKVEETLISLFPKKDEIIPLTPKEIAKMIGNSKADVTIRFGTGKEGTFLGFESSEKRPTPNTEIIKRHGYLNGNIERIVGDCYILEPPLDFQLGFLKLYGNNEILRKKVKRLVIKIPDPKPWGEDGEFYDSRTEFHPIQHNGNVIEIARSAGIHEISYSGITSSDIKRMSYKPENIFKVSWTDRNGYHEYCYPDNN